MASSVVEIYNQALSVIGTRSAVTAVDENSVEAEKCTLWYSTVRDQILGAAPWASVKSTARLALLSSRNEDLQWAVGDPTPGWNFAYAVPSNLLRPRYFSSYARFELGVTDDNKKVIYTNQEEALLIYTRMQPRVDMWDIDLQQAVTFGLAAHIAMSITGDPNKVSLATGLAIEKINIARERQANQDQTAVETIPEWLAARGYAGVAPEAKYLFPSAEFTVSSGFMNVT